MVVGYFSAVGGSRYLYGRPLKKAYRHQHIRWASYLAVTVSIVFGAVAPAFIKASTMVKASSGSNGDYALAEAITPEFAASKEPMSENAVLNQALSRWATQHPGQRWGIALEDLSNNELAGVNTTNFFRSASVYKLFLVYPLLQKVPVEKLQTTMIIVGGKQRSLDDCINAMLLVSDNACGEAIGDYVGWSQADKMIRSAGFTGTHLKFDAPTTTASDTTHYLSELYRGKLVNQAGVDYIFNILGQQKFRSGIPAACNTNCQVMNKTGELSGILNDAAVIKIGEKLFILSIFSEKGRNSDVADVSKIIIASQNN